MGKARSYPVGYLFLQADYIKDTTSVSEVSIPDLFHVIMLCVRFLQHYIKYATGGSCFNCSFENGYLWHE